MTEVNILFHFTVDIAHFNVLTKARVYVRVYLAFMLDRSTGIWILII